MISSLTDAPSGMDLTLIRVADPMLETRLGRMGLFQDSVVVRMDEEVALDTVRVRGPRGEVVLGGGMGGKILVHLDDGRILPLVEMRPGEKGHVECVNAGNGLRDGLAALGLNDDDTIECVRKLPPMEYVALLPGRGRIRLAEGMAAKILGRMGPVHCQFATAQAGAEFEVTQVIGGARARRAIGSLDIAPGVRLTLESVSKASSYHMETGNRIVVASREGLRLFLRRDQADLLTVSYEDEKGVGA